MAKQLPEIIWNLPQGKFPDEAESLIQDYIYKRFTKIINSFEQEQKQRVCEIIMEDIVRNKGENFGEYFYL